ncbi:hypothetical protein LCAA2362_0823 [Lacticaseibacillus casei A2-362]|nr:hypothetical protein LCAA2362_0823 [Lacticaseibacillus casei A2-362]
MDDLLGCLGIVLIVFLFIYYWYLAIPISLVLAVLTIWLVKRRKAKQKETSDDFVYTTPPPAFRPVKPKASKEDLNDEISNLEEKIKELKNEQQDLIRTNKDAISIIVNKGIKRIDKLNGREFEKYCGRMLESLGFEEVNVTVSSGDQGIDILAKMGKTSYGFQCKHYSSPVGNKALQEAISGKEYYKIDKAVVITNNYFTPSAIALAQEAGVDTWNRDTLIDFLHDQVVPEVTNKEQYESQSPVSNSDSQVDVAESQKNEWADF